MKSENIFQNHYHSESIHDRTMAPVPETIAVIGTGRLGAALARSLHDKNFSIDALIDQNLSLAQKLKPMVDAKKCAMTVFDMTDVDMIFIAVPDDAIAAVVSDLEICFREKLKITYIYHTSGVLASDVFDSIRKYGIAGASFHPIQTFSGQADDWQKLENIYIGIEGDVAAIEKANQIVEALGSRSIQVPAKFKSHYHLACTMASNYLIALMIPVVEVLQKMGWSERETWDAMHPLIMTTITNLKQHGIERALTGPIARGDPGTIARHLQLLARDFPAYQSVYQQLGQLLLNVKSVPENLSRETYENLRQLMSEKRA